ncbi:hypothetical protein ACFQ88_08865 [Paenibacillus sp. NPDC056579]|uniref:hypothetical protein n=1 Tax=unclassified Paenibacillus TaxID=185978 RepID=UPI001EF868DB|nr:hypothetical protein [Paenibacillus sp. H1-7]
MYNQPEEVRLQTLYQMDHSSIQSLHSNKEHITNLCNQYLNHPVRVQTLHGQTYDGYIVHVDPVHVYLRPMPGHVRGFFSPFNNYYNDVILPLVLYELLVISLLV